MMATKKQNIFISFSTKDKPKVEKLVKGLEDENLNCWVCYRDIKPGENWAGSIIDAINSCEIFVFVASTNSNVSPECAREVERASSKRKKIFAFILEEIELSQDLEYFLGNQQWTNAVNVNFSNAVSDLADGIKDHLALPSESSLAKKAKRIYNSLISSSKKPVLAAICLFLLLILIFLFSDTDKSQKTKVSSTKSYIQEPQNTEPNFIITTDLDMEEDELEEAKPVKAKVKVPAKTKIKAVTIKNGDCNSTEGVHFCKDSTLFFKTNCDIKKIRKCQYGCKKGKCIKNLNRLLDELSE